MTQLLNDVMNDADVLAIPETKIKDPIPFYAQISGSPRHGIFLGDAQEEQQEGERDAAQRPASQFTDAEILSTMEFQNYVEMILGGTIYNLMQEANVGEFDLQKFPMMIEEDQLHAVLDE
jgi:hypothetical protein